MPEIQRINRYDDERFSNTVLYQHGAFLVDDSPCEVEITGTETAVVRCENQEYVAPLLEEFRFFCRAYLPFLR